MAEITGIDKLLSFLPNKRFGKFCKFGTSQLGFSHFGDNDIYYLITGFGDSVLGVSKFCNAIPLSGIYRTDNVTGKTKFYREPYYITKNPRTEAQQTQREKFASAVLAWQSLTQEQKNPYNMRAERMNLSGYNLFLREYLLSH